MAFVQPTMNLAVNIWFAAGVPPVGAPNVVTLGNLSPGRITSEEFGAFGNVMYLRLPALVDIRINSIVEVPGGTQRWYQVLSVDDIGKGFANEHRFAMLLAQQANWPVPYP